LSQFFIDTSALAKRYLSETGSNWVRSWINPEANNEIIISALATVEIHSLLMRREREGSITSLERTSMLNDFQEHVQDEYLIIDLDDEVLDRARNLLSRHSLRTLDALQLACALEVSHLLQIIPTFLSADTRLRTAAAAESLPADDPNAHP
jgi:predicted nucleic acid-binding protein